MNRTHMEGDNASVRKGQGTAAALVPAATNSPELEVRISAQTSNCGTVLWAYCLFGTEKMIHPFILTPKKVVPKKVVPRTTSMGIDPDNHWRILANGWQPQPMGDVVRIADLSDVLVDQTRYIWEQTPFSKWFNQYYPGRHIIPKLVYPEWRFNEGVDGGFTKEGRNSFLCIYAKLKHEGLWSEVKTVHWVGPTGEMLFVPQKKSEQLQNDLVKQGYGDWFHAKKIGHAWGVRSRVIGAELHFLDPKDKNGFINVHIDLHNPGELKLEDLGNPIAYAMAARHWQLDDNERPNTHVWSELRKTLEQQGVLLPPKSN